MLFSIIVPVYNVEQYLQECVNSIIQQNYDDYELILVDDGSKDSSGNICDEYSSKNSKITTIHKPNGGLSDARNAGLKVANGEYVLFIDSDDYIANGSLANIAECIFKHSPDVVFLNANKLFPNGKIISLGDNYNPDKINKRSKADVMKHLASLPKYPGSACTKSIKREVIINNSLFFEKGLLSEDIDWTMKLLTLSETFAFCDTDYYYYRQSRQGSISNTKTIKNTQCLLYIIKKWASKDLKNPYQKEINSFVAYEYMIALLCYIRLSESDQKQLFNDFKCYKWVLKYGKTKKCILTNIAVNILGINLTAKMLKMVKNKKTKSTH